MCTQSISADSEAVSSTLVKVKMIWNQARPVQAWTGRSWA